LIEHAVGDHQIGERLAELGAVDHDAGALSFSGGGVFFERNGTGAGVLGDLKALARELLAGRREGEIIVVAGHALDFDEMLLAHVLEHGVDHGDHHAQGTAESGEAGVAFDEHAAEHEVQNQGFGNSEFGEGLGDRRAEGVADGCKGGHGYLCIGGGTGGDYFSDARGGGCPRPYGRGWSWGVLLG